MPVFKAYFIVIKRYLPSLLIYFFIFIIMTILFSKVIGSQTSFSFTAVKANVVVNTDESSPLIDGLVKYISDNANIVTVGNGTESIQDALFYGKADYVLRIPAGFTESFMSGSNVITLEKTTGTMSGDSVNMDVLINQYLNTARLYTLNVPGISAEDLARDVAINLNNTAGVDFAASDNQVNTSILYDTFRYMAYAVLAIMLMGVVSIMMAFNDPELAKRNLCAPLKPYKMYLQMFFGNTALTVIVWAAMCILALVLSGVLELSPGVLLLCLNILVFSICSLAIAFLAGKFVKSQIALAAVANIISLGVCFLSGIFVPQDLLGVNVLRIASFTPGYWYVKAIDTIKDLPAVTFDNVRPILGDMLIQLGFAAACIIIALVATKQKRQNMER
jgi:ABC-2 type transport system permease protein